MSKYLCKLCESGTNKSNYETIGCCAKCKNKTEKNKNSNSIICVICDGKSSIPYIKMHGLCACCNKKRFDNKPIKSLSTVDNKNIEQPVAVDNKNIEQPSVEQPVAADNKNIEQPSVEQPVADDNKNSESVETPIVEIEGLVEPPNTDNNELNFIIDIYNKSRFDTAKLSKGEFIKTLRFRINEFIDELD